VTTADDDPLPSVSIAAEAMHYEGNVGTTNISIDDFVTPASGRTVQVAWGGVHSTRGPLETRSYTWLGVPAMTASAIFTARWIA
jgi:hypothetical protein